VESGDDPAERGSVSDGNFVRDSHDDPRGSDVNVDQLETISGDVSVDSPAQDNDSDSKVLRSGVHSTSRLHSLSKILAVKVQLFRPPEFAMPFVIINRMLRE
jgi:hypothetical protein